MVDVQVVLDGRDAESPEAVDAVGTLLRPVSHVDVLGAPDPTWRALGEQYADSVIACEGLRRDVPLLVVSPRVVFAAGAVRRMVKHTQSPGRAVTRVFVPGLAADAQVTCWSSTWLQTYAGDVVDLLDAGVAFDREHLSPSSPTARLWVRGENVGVSLRVDVPGRLSRWAIRTGAELDAGALWAASVRGPAGAAKRRLARRRQRRAQSPRT